MWHGRVESSKDACEVHRNVKLFEVDGPGPDKLIGKDRSNREGKWRFKAEPQADRFSAEVVRRKEGTAGTTFVCGGDRSEILH